MNGRVYFCRDVKKLGMSTFEVLGLRVSLKLPRPRLLRGQFTPSSSRTALPSFNETRYRSATKPLSAAQLPGDFGGIHTAS